MSYKLTLLGTGSSGGVPRIGNHWGACDPANPKNRRRRCAALIERVSGRVYLVIGADRFELTHQAATELHNELHALGTVEMMERHGLTIAL